MFPGIELERNEWQYSQPVGERFYHLSKHTVYDSKKRVIGSVLTLWDDTERELELQRERYIANHDPLTGLYTKQHLFDKVREAIDANPDMTYYVAYSDIKNFKLINDVFGQEFGDYTLKSLAADIQNKLPPTALYGRLGGDVFGLCFSERDFNAEIAEKYMSEFLIANGTVSYRIMVHQGVYEVVDRSIDVSVMFDRAHIAMETIRNDYKKHVVLYDDAMRQKVLWKQDISMQLPDAMAKGEICPYLQPIVDARGTVVGAEALVRWLHPERGLIPPADFIPVLEDNGTVADIDRFMWRRACEILKQWERVGRDDLFLSVNVSPKDFYFMDVPEEFRSIVREFGLPPQRLRIEITESVMMVDVDKRFDILHELQSDGFIIEMDDFGSGYSSLNMLKDMPVELIKIDMLFLRDTEQQSRSSVILRNMIHMMAELGLVPLTEGVETEEQYRMLEQMGCKLFQGYLFARPMPVDQFEETYLKG